MTPKEAKPLKERRVSTLVDAEFHRELKTHIASRGLTIREFLLEAFKLHKEHTKGKV